MKLAFRYLTTFCNLVGLFIISEVENLTKQTLLRKNSS